MNFTTLSDWLRHQGLQANMAELSAYTLIIVLILLIALAATWLVRRTLLPALINIIHKNRLHWDDSLIEHRFFHKISWFVPILVIHVCKDLLLIDDSDMSRFLSRALLACVVIVASSSISALLSSVNDIYTRLAKKRSSTIRGYTDAARIIVYVFCAIFLIAIFTGRSPWGLLSLLGGLTAIILLVFKDTLLGFVATIQLSATDMVRIGDWIQMDKYGADGDVIDISIHCVLVQNWNKTVTSIPTYALISNSFINWRGMSESGGRRIKRSINIDISSIHFVDAEELEKLNKITILKNYLRPKQKEVEAYNTRHEIETDLAINGRNQTNIGIFRAYVQEYLHRNPNIHPNMTFLVRQLAPTETGLPLEIYVFSKDQIWANYEAIQADIFDHLFAALSTFGLRAFQNPSGHDFQQSIGHHN
ncbi:MAG TPA: mechanosensitive ion channel family protein [Desulfocapsa sulfexigens]|nr:mechanosensitive ion channel family protein [Desulfocapsa sulfexigens]HIQ37874.1 mechanosensitive ion channel family protein [Desulfocapsa sulfexigens]